MKRYVGFYWTFPARWAGFVALSQDAEVAARQSKTIAYQRAIVTRYVASEKGEMVGEVVALESSPDRGTETIAGEVARARALCLAKQATLLWVDFANTGWRPHRHFTNQIISLEEAGVSSVPIPADEIMLNHDLFVPEDHFAMWREGEREFKERLKTLVPEALRRALLEVPKGYGQFVKIAALLNSHGVPTLGGGHNWTADNVRKAIENLSLTTL